VSSRRGWARFRRLGYAAVLAPVSFVYVAGTFQGLEDVTWLYLSKWAGCVVLLLWLVVAGKGRFSARMNTPLRAVFLLALLGLLAQAGENMDARALQLAFGYLLTGTVAFAAAPVGLRRRWVRVACWRGLLVGVMAGMALAMALGIVYPLDSLLLDADRVRYKGFFQRPNSAGWYSFVGVVLSVAVALDTRRARYLLLVPLLAVPAVLANSRGAVVAMAALGVLWVLTHAVRPGTAWWVRASTAVILVVAAATVLTDSGGSSGSLFGPGELDRITSGRWSNWTSSLAYLDTPMRVAFGLGLGRNVTFVPGNYGLRGGEGDSFYVDLIGRTGVIGLLIFVTMVCALGARLLFRLFTSDRRAGPGTAFSVALLGAVLLYGVVESHLFTSGTLHAPVMWSLIGRYATAPVPR
jgi:hypothetical protein